MRWYYWSLFVFVLSFSPNWSFASAVVAPFEVAQATPSDQTTQTEGEEQKEDESFWQATTKDPVALYTLVLTVFTGVLALSTIGLMIQTKRLAQDAERNSVTTQRAFVFATTINPYWNFDAASGQYHWRFRPTWRNAGDTPTRNMRIHTNCELRNTPLPDSFDFNYTTTNVGTGNLGPKFEQQGGIAPGEVSQAITVQDIIDVQNERKFLYLMGWIRYDDVFPETPERLTRFCWQIIPVGDAATYNPNPPADKPNSLYFPFVHHHKGNCADDECQI